MKKVLLLLAVLLLLCTCALAEENELPSTTKMTMTMTLTVPDRTISVYTGEHLGVRLGEEVYKETEGVPAAVPAPRLEDLTVSLEPDNGWQVFAVSFDSETTVGTYDSQAAQLAFAAVPADETVHVTVIPKCEAQLSLPGALSEICEEAFMGNTQIAQADMNEGLTTVGAAAFKGCTGLRLVSLPSTLTQIAGDAFDGCHEDLTFLCATQAQLDWANSNGFTAYMKTEE